VEVYKRETREVIQRFLDHKTSFPGCISALDAALAALIPILHPTELGSLRALMLANNAMVMEEMERREQAKPRPITPIPS
jgi:hypothetical protein